MIGFRFSSRIVNVTSPKDCGSNPIRPGSITRISRLARDGIVNGRSTASTRSYDRGLFHFQPTPDHRLEHHGDVGNVGADPEDVWNAGLKAAAG
jgi:hypothetical protein